MLKVLDLFSGIGGMSLGLKWAGGFETVAFCEIEKYPQEILKKHWPGVPVYDDIRQRTADRLVSDGIEGIQVITGGYPCQPFSVAGQQRGEADDRHLWPEMLRLIAEVRPAWVICENVTGHIKLGLDQVLSDLEAEGYSSRTFIIPACAVNAPHRRDRVWIVADTNKLTRGSREVHRKPSDKGRAASTAGGESIRPKDNEAYASNPATCGEDVADSESQRVEGCWADRQQEPSLSFEKRIPGRDCAGFSADHWAIEPGMGRVAHGIPGRVAKLKGLGNAVVPQIPMTLGKAILEYEKVQILQDKT